MKAKRFEVKIRLGSDAFAEDPRPEIRKVLLDLVDRLHNSADVYCLQDSNGNTCGTAAFNKADFRRI
jgi:hypothetical protein